MEQGSMKQPYNIMSFTKAGKSAVVRAAIMTADEERAIAQCARRLTAAIEEPESTHVEELVEQVRDEAGGQRACGTPVGRRGAPGAGGRQARRR